MVSVSLYVEGGGDSKRLKNACRRSFGKFIERAGVSMNMLRIEVCGSRGNAYNDFRRALAGKENAMLLVDSEVPVTAQGPWEHLKAGDNWDRPTGASDGQCHLMVQAMESWFLADRQALGEYYGPGFQSSALPPNPSVEQIPKQDILDGLSRAARSTPKGTYNKGVQSYEILESWTLLRCGRYLLTLTALLTRSFREGLSPCMGFGDSRESGSDGVSWPQRCHIPP
jgi:hypothetical protein